MSMNDSRARINLSEWKKENYARETLWESWNFDFWSMDFFSGKNVNQKNWKNFPSARACKQGTADACRKIIMIYTHHTLLGFASKSIWLLKTSFGEWTTVYVDLLDGNVSLKILHKKGRPFSTQSSCGAWSQSKALQLFGNMNYGKREQVGAKCNSWVVGWLIECAFEEFILINYTTQVLHNRSLKFKWNNCIKVENKELICVLRRKNCKRRMRKIVKSWRIICATKGMLCALCRSSVFIERVPGECNATVLLKR